MALLRETAAIALPSASQSQQLMLALAADQLLAQLDRLQEQRRQQRAEAKPGQASIPFEKGAGKMPHFEARGSKETLL
jgi:type II secretory pathway pseudopilin PulG